ncbi:MAG: DUF3990 domain-containing protein [Coriobacteriales bacterium]|nr:DUF3990 domain-containing protein [Coriobacteriales bacterium]
MDSIQTLYHGSTAIIKKPQFGKGSRSNDYGYGFYCTKDLGLAKEWACGSKLGGFANVYTIDTAGLAIMCLNEPEYGILDWLAVLVNNREFDITSPIAADAKEYLTEFFLPDTDAYDAIIGYRADDSYFAFAQDFLNNTISLRQLNRAMHFGSLGEQFVLKSQKAFGLIRFVESIPADGEVYHQLRLKRDSEAREQYLRRERKAGRGGGDVYLATIIDEEMRHGDERLQEILRA